jgi:flagellar biosynthesis protein FlhG
MIFPNATSSRHFEEIATRLMSEGADVPVHKRGISCIRFLKSLPLVSK